MNGIDDVMTAEYLSECRDHVEAMGQDLVAIEQGGAAIDDEIVNRVFRAVRSIKGGAGYFDLLKIRELAHGMEEKLELIRGHRMVPTQDRIGVLLRATDRLDLLLQNPGSSNHADISAIMTALSRLSPDAAAPVAGGGATVAARVKQGGGRLRVLIAEDDFASRVILQTFLSRRGDCHVAVNGKEAVDAVRVALEQGQNYDLICMDIMMPVMDGREAVERVRALEEEHGILSTRGAKIIMVTAVTDIKEVICCFRALCDSYLVKPIDLNELTKNLKTLQLVP